LRYHLYDNVTTAGAHTPGTAVNNDPTAGVPDTTGTGVAVNARPTVLPTLVLLRLVNPSLEPVTVTVIDFAKSALTNVYVLSVAPEIATPARFH
jgi:hypothetical protein